MERMRWQASGKKARDGGKSEEAAGGENHGAGGAGGDGEGAYGGSGDGDGRDGCGMGAERPSTCRGRTSTACDTSSANRLWKTIALRCTSGGDVLCVGGGVPTSSRDSLPLDQTLSAACDGMMEDEGDIKMVQVDDFVSFGVEEQGKECVRLAR